MSTDRKETGDRQAALKRQMDSHARGFGRRAWFLNQDKIDDFGLKVWRPKQGKNYICILPPLNPTQYFGKELYIHWNIGPEEDAFLCPKFMLGAACPICEEWTKLRKLVREQDLQEDERLAKQMKDMSPLPPRLLYLIRDVENHQTEELGIQVFVAPITVDQGIVSITQRRRGEPLIDASDADNGRTVIFVREGTGPRNTRYIGFQFEERDPIPDEWLEIPDFNDLIVFASYEEIARSFLGPKEAEAEPAGGSAEPAKEALEPERREPAEERTRRGRTEAAPAAGAPAERPARGQVAESAAERPARGRVAEVPAERPARSRPAEPVAGGSPESEAPRSDDLRDRVRQRLARRQQALKEDKDNVPF